MKTINDIIENSALGTMNNYYRYAIASLFMAILTAVFSLLVYVFGHMDYVSACFDF